MDPKPTLSEQAGEHLAEAYELLPGNERAIADWTYRNVEIPARIEELETLIPAVCRRCRLHGQPTGRVVASHYSRHNGHTTWEHGAYSCVSRSLWSRISELRATLAQEER